MKLTRMIMVAGGGLSLVLGLALSAGAQQFGDRCLALNTRPVPLGHEFITGLNIQDMIDVMTVAGVVINAEEDMNRHAAFRPGLDGAVLFTYCDGRYFGADNRVGLYEITDPTNRFPVFTDPVAFPGAKVLIQFYPNGNVRRNGEIVATNFRGCFGIYQEVYGGTPRSGGSGNPSVLDWVHFSEDALNTNGDPQMLVYRGNGSCWLQMGSHNPVPFTRDSFLIGVESQPVTVAPLLLAADRDYNEAVFVMSGATTYRRFPPLVAR